MFEILKFLLPPVDKNDTHATTWRFIMFFVVMVLIAYVLIAEGVILNNGHARASDLARIQEQFTSEISEVRTTLESIELNGLEQAIERWHKRQCQAATAGNQQALIIVREELRKKLQEYLRITGQRYIVFGCDG